MAETATRPAGLDASGATATAAPEAIAPTPPSARASRRAAIAAALISQPGESNRAIAADLGVDDTTVGDARRRLETTAGIPQFETRKGKDDKTRRRPPSKPKTALVATAADLAALAAEVKLDRDLNNARFAALEHSDTENRKLLGREPPAPTSGSEWGQVKEVAHLTGFSISGIRSLINREQVDSMMTPAGRTIVRIASVPPRRCRAKCE